MNDALPMSLVDAALRGTLVALLLLLAVTFGRDRPRSPSARAGLILALGLCVQVVGSMSLLEARLPRVWQAPLVAISVGNAVLFWIFVQAIFDDEFRLRSWHVAAWLAAASLGALNCTGAFGSAQILAPVAAGLQRVIPSIFAVLAAAAAAMHWRADLVERRRRLRVFIVAAGVAYTLAMIAVRSSSSNGRLSDMAATLDIAALTFIVAVVAGQLLRLGGSDLFPSAAPAKPAIAYAGPAEELIEPDAPPTNGPTPPDPVQERLVESLQRVMVRDHAYRTEDLTVASLAARLAVPEYRLRRLINQRLGHRNFNAYVNGFRLEDACAALADPSKRELPILSIALEAGFQSIGPFNRAFKSATGQTPSDFRREKLADS